MRRLDVGRIGIRCLLGTAGAACLLLATVGGAAGDVAGGAVARAGVARPGAEPLPAFVALRDVDPSVAEEMRYASAHNFTGTRVDGYREAVCLLTRPAAEALSRAQRSLLARGYGLKVYDCYRPRRAVAHFVRWARDASDQRTKAEFYPRVDKSRLFAEGYIAERSGHSRGSTVDVTLVRLPGREGRPGDVDMGSPFDLFDPVSHTADPTVGPRQHAHRTELGAALAAQGFVNLPEEWWHFTYRPEPYPDTYFDVPVALRVGRSTVAVWQQQSARSSRTRTSGRTTWPCTPAPRRAGCT
ncbi:M15 family metallopeptidase [Streptomyces sp. NRRL S-87]|uniref:M15 family metallopeptidase n=1 Tax=Streptomyces sp. NRRL S-87 TaxID=1463920 RepID=UPI00099D5FDD|nr:M15 family metallopeptidase [Streptomyces sp. NRRL S-87]